MKKERDLFDIIKEAQEEIIEEDPVTKGDEILFGRDGKPLSHHRCNICDILFKEYELLDNPDIGLICETCNDNMDELDREQGELKTLFRAERNSKAGI